MAWSTRRLAELAGSTVKAIRYYHEIGLLDEPDRRSNGYKQYEVPHLVRLLQIKRLRELGIPLSQIPATGQAADESDQALRVLDAELEATVDRLNRIRAELAVLLRHRTPAHTPPAFAPTIAQGVPEAHQSMLMVYSTVLSDRASAVLQEMLAERDSVDVEFENLPADADAAAIESLAERMVSVVLRSREKYPEWKDLAADAPGGAKNAEDTIAQAMFSLYNMAQLRVLHELNIRLVRLRLA
ncbi:MerR family transcriptional regulator [Nocardia carnea]|uniref:MerR family transcriptional regulator n=1 Tax=Nocardia carnea TaxID=37328 RepID=UPI0024579403|nr:MerR family transcriptional regulator [Nocardia carnea]